MSYSRKVFTFCCFLFYFSATAQQDKNIVLQSIEQQFRFVRGDQLNPVQIRESYTKVYRCNNFRSSLLFSEMYNDKEKIDDVQIRVNEKKNKSIQPKYDYYSIDGIFYSDAKVCYFQLPLEKQGSTSEVSIEKTYTDPRYFTSVYFPEDVLAENKTVVFRIPKWMNVELREYNFKEYNIHKSKSFDSDKNEDVITYSIKNLAAYEHEESSPGSSYTLPHILVLCKKATPDNSSFIYFNTLNDQYKWYRELIDSLDTNQDIIKAKAAEITKGMLSETDKVTAIFDWVQHNIRYLAFEDGIAGFRPAKAADVLNKKYGDCKGMANLTRSLIRSLGMDARLCWIGTNHIAYDYSTPSLSVDNHMICAWFYKGKKYFLDATETNIGLNEYAERIQDRQVLIENGDQYILERIPATTPGQNLQKEKITITPDPSGNCKGSISLICKGESKSSLLSTIQITQKDKLQEKLSDYLSGKKQDFSIVNLKTTDLAGKDSVLAISFDFEHKNGASVFGNEIYVEPEHRKEFAGLYIDSAKRSTDYLLPYKIQVLTETELIIPVGYKTSSLPAGGSWQHPNISVRISFQQTGNKILYKKEIVIKDPWLKKENFNTWNHIVKAFTDLYKEQIILIKQ